MTVPPIDGIVLAAGRSRRIGRSKPLLRVRRPSGSVLLSRAGERRPEGGGDESSDASSNHSPMHARAGGEREGGTDESETFLERAVRLLKGAGCRAVTVVVAADDDAVRRLAGALGAIVVENAETDSEPIDSVRLAIASLPEDSAAAVVLPVDAPLVATGTIAAVVQAFAARRAPIVAPSYSGEPGHPVLIARSLFSAVLSEPLEQGLRSLLASRRNDLEAVPVDDPGTLIDVDTPEDYDRLVVQRDIEMK